jgi:hypothetical protein
MAQMVQCLPSKRMALSFNLLPQTNKQKPKKQNKTKKRFV